MTPSPPPGTDPTTRAGPTAEVVVFDGFDEVDVFGPLETLAVAGFDVTLVAVQSPGPVVSTRRVRIDVEAVLGRPDLLLVPGGGWLDHAPEGSWAQAQRRTLPERLAELAPTTPVMASVCTGSLLLASAGLLTGRHATTNRNAFDELAGYDVDVLDERVVDDGPIITAGGLTAGFDLALWIVERQLGTAVADRVSRSLEHTRQGRVWRSGAQGSTATACGAAGGAAQGCTPVRRG